MDGQNFGNGQNTENQNNSVPQYSAYQDNTAKYSYQAAPGIENTAVSSAANGLQIASLVLGIISIVICCCYGVPSIILGIAGIICSIIGNKENKHSVGTAGLVCSIIGLILGIMALIIIIVSIYINGGIQAILDQYYQYYELYSNY